MYNEIGKYAEKATEGLVQQAVWRKRGCNF